MSLSVHKFGGAALATVDRIHEVARLLASFHAKGNPLIVAVSAMGHETDRLKDLAYELSNSPSPRELDILLSAGERVSMSLLAIALNRYGVPSSSFTGSQSGILTDSCHGNAKIEEIRGDRIRTCLASRKVAIVAGFQGMNLESKDITTLGRGGTDLTALALSHCFEAAQCTLYKDVEGVLEADPRIIPAAKVVARLSWGEMVELSWSGAGVVHARAAELAMKVRIPFRIKSFLSDTASDGTLVSGDPDLESFYLSSISQRSPLGLLRKTLRGSQKDCLQQLQTIQAWFWQRDCAPLLMETDLTDAGATALRLLVPLDLASRFIDECGREDLRVTSPLAALTLVGNGFKQNPEVLDTILGSLPEMPLLTSVSCQSLTLCLQESAMKESLVALHKALEIYRNS